MAIIEIQPPANPDDQYVWGWDTEVGDWVEVDIQAAEGSTLGNIGRAATRGLESVGAGIEELTGYRGAQQHVQDVAARQAAAARGAPIAEAVGGFAPEAAAGGAAALFTGGLSIPASLAIESLAGGAVSGLRPGTFEERILAAAESTGLNLAGGTGILAALKLGRGILGSSGKRIAAGVEAGQERAAARAAAETAAPGEIAPAVTPEAPAPGGRSVGAAELPIEEMEPGAALERGVLEAGDVGGFDVMDDQAMARLADRAQELGMPTPIGFGSRRGSPARMLQSVQEFTPLGRYTENAWKAGQSARMGELAAESLGFPGKGKSLLMQEDIATVEGKLGNDFERVQRGLPDIDGEAYARVLEKAGQQTHGVFGKTAGQKTLQNAIDAAREKGGVTGAEFMNDRSWLSSEIARLYSQGDTASGDVLQRAIQKMDDLASKELKRRGKERTGELWETARRQWQLLIMIKRPGAVSGTGEINPRSLFNAMRRNKSSGGFGADGPPREVKPLRDLWDALQIANASESQVPATGARLIARDALRGPIGQAAAGGLGAATIWDLMQ